MIELDKIYNEDCLEGMKRIADGSIDLIVADPPYLVAKPHNGGQMFADKKLYDYQQELDDSNLCDGYDICRFAEEVCRLQKGINLYVWCNKQQIPEYFSLYVNRLKCKFDILCWHKKNALPTFSNKYLSDTEYCLYFHTNGSTKPQCYEDARTYDVGLINNKDKKIFNHPCVKPLSFHQRIIRNSSKPGDVVLDPFMGSGTTAVACINEKRHFIGFETNKEYFDIAQGRIDEIRRNPMLF